MRLAVAPDWQRFGSPPPRLGSADPHPMSPDAIRIGSAAAAATLAGLLPRTGRTTSTVVDSSDSAARAQSRAADDEERGRAGRDSSKSVDRIKPDAPHERQDGARQPLPASFQGSVTHLNTSS